MISFMKNIKNFAIYGLSVGSLSNICAMDDWNNLLKDLTNVLAGNDKEAGLDLLNKHIFSAPEKTDGLTNVGCVYYQFFQKKPDSEEKTENLFVLFHGLGQSLEEYSEDIDKLQGNFKADVLLIEYNLNGGKTNTFGDMEKYCNNVAQFITENKFRNGDKVSYNKIIFFGYSLGSFVGNLVRKNFNEINKEKIGKNEITSKYIGYKGIKDLENAGSSFIKTFANNSKIKIEEKNICSIINIAVNGLGILGEFLGGGGGNNISIKNFSDLFKYLLGDEEYNKIKTLTTNALILNDTKGFNKEKVEFNDDLKTKDHCIDLKKDIDSILKVFNSEENKDKDVFLFQVNGGDEVVGNGMKETYTSLTGKEPKKNPNPAKQKDGKEKGDSTPIPPQGGQPQGGQPQGGQPPKQDDKENDPKSGSCYGF